MLAAAGEFLNDRIVQFNSRVYECNKVGPLTLPFTSDEVTLPTAVFKELECCISTAAGATIRQLNYIDWAEYKHVFEWTGSWVGVAPHTYYTFFNVELYGKLKLLPTNGTATGYITLSYYRRLPSLADETEVMDVPPEIQRALVLAAQSDMLRVFKSGDTQAFAATEALARQAWDEFSAIDLKHPDQKFRFRLPPLAYNRYPMSDVVYIRV